MGLKRTFAFYILLMCVIDKSFRNSQFDYSTSGPLKGDGAIYSTNHMPRLMRKKWNFGGRNYVDLLGYFFIMLVVPYFFQKLAIPYGT